MCAEAADVVARTCEDLGVGWDAVDVDTDENLRAAYTDHVPVVFTDGRLHGYWFVDADKLKQALESHQPRPMKVGWRPSQHPD